MSDIQIRSAEPTDCTQILSLIRELAEFEKLSREVVATPELLQHALFGAAPTAHALVAESRSGAVGFALYFFNFSTFLGQPGLYLEDLYVQPAHRSAGLGRRLLIELAAIAQARGCGRMEWAVLDWNTRARSFYESLGAMGMTDWTVHRLTGDALHTLAAQSK